MVQAVTVRIGVDCDWPDCGSIALSPDLTTVSPPDNVTAAHAHKTLIEVSVTSAVLEGYTHTEEGQDFCDLHSLHDIATRRNK